MKKSREKRLRDRAALAALPAFVTLGLTTNLRDPRKGETRGEYIARSAYEAADFFIAARKKAARKGKKKGGAA